ncbi:hypothetical protein [Parapedobacter lycopersici]|uniref:hypothetical protein n=1 Tax=Parapedobacter lycopersici TaxID=1864939 RepID=UPI00214D7361|nr:hypothetical protein [Parapedobacter lycopersici]
MITTILMTIAGLPVGEPKTASALKKFVLVVRVPQTYDSEQAKKVGPAWDMTLESWKTEGVYVESFAFPAPGYIVTGRDRQVEAGLVTWGGQKVVSIVVLQAENITQATALAKQCPILEHGGTVEVRERPQ